MRQHSLAETKTAFCQDGVSLTFSDITPDHTLVKKSLQKPVTYLKQHLAACLYNQSSGKYKKQKVTSIQIEMKSILNTLKLHLLWTHQHCIYLLSVWKFRRDIVKKEKMYEEQIWPQNVFIYKWWFDRRFNRIKHNWIIEKVKVKHNNVKT